MDFPLQYILIDTEKKTTKCRNPYFSGFSLAIHNAVIYNNFIINCRNPYFSGFSLAIDHLNNDYLFDNTSQSLF